MNASYIVLAAVVVALLVLVWVMVSSSTGAAFASGLAKSTVGPGAASTTEGYYGSRFGYYGARGRYGKNVPYGNRFHPWGRRDYSYPIYPGMYSYGGYPTPGYGNYYRHYAPYYRPYRPYNLPQAGWW